MAALTVEQSFQIAVAHHQAGRLAEAEPIYRQLLSVEPRHVNALLNLGAIASQKGRHDIAMEMSRRALAVKPGYPQANFNLGIALCAVGRIDESIVAYQDAIAVQADYPEAYCNLALALSASGRPGEAVAACRAAIGLRPGYPEAYSNLGNALRDLDQLGEAVAAYRHAIAVKPDMPEAHSNLGNVLRERGQPDEAIAACRYAILLKPDFPEAHYNLGNALQAKGRFEEAIVAYRQAVALRPEYAEAHNNLGAALKETGRLGDAITAFRRAIALRPGLGQTYGNLGNTLWEQGMLDEAAAAYRQGVSLNPELPELGSNLLFGLNYPPGLDAGAVADEHRRWGHRHGEPLLALIEPHGNDANAERPLRIGYVSPDFRSHSVAFFLEGLLSCHAPAQVEVFCYASVARPDSVTDRLRALVPHWRDIARMSDEEAARAIRSDGIDILVDLAGHTADNRLPVFARKPAPIQVTWLGYSNTTGLTAMDYRLTDGIADPPAATEHLHTERLIRLPDCAWCYRADGNAPPVSPLPVLQAGHITFGCFNAAPKITIPQLILWAGILRAVPDSRIIAKNRSFQDAAARQRVQSVLENEGIAPQRIDLAGYVPELAIHLGAYARVDIALDTFPYHGTTTTCEALWMGVPVVTLAGKTHASRVGASLLTTIGLRELIASTPEEYTQVATRLAADHPRLAELRHTMRERMRSSPLMDAPGFARRVECAYRDMWRRWCMATERAAKMRSIQ